MPAAHALTRAVTAAILARHGPLDERPTMQRPWEGNGLARRRAQGRASGFPPRPFARQAREGGPP